MAVSEGDCWDGVEEDDSPLGESVRMQQSLSESVEDSGREEGTIQPLTVLLSPVPTSSGDGEVVRLAAMICDGWPGLV